MPYVGLQDGRKVIPPEVSDDQPVVCPRCGEQMHVVPSHERAGTFISRHFSHQGSSGPGGGDGRSGGNGCSGESDRHRRMKSIVYARLQHEFPNATVSLEATVGDRRPDVLAVFPTSRLPYGNGIAVEVQYKNRDKDRKATTDYYFDRAYSVAWVEPQDFEPNNVALSIDEVWPSGCDEVNNVTDLTVCPLSSSTSIFLGPQSGTLVLALVPIHRCGEFVIKEGISRFDDTHRVQTVEISPEDAGQIRKLAREVRETLVPPGSSSRTDYPLTAEQLPENDPRGRYQVGHVELISTGGVGPYISVECEVTNGSEMGSMRNDDPPEITGISIRLRRVGTDATAKSVDRTIVDRLEDVATAIDGYW